MFDHINREALMNIFQLIKNDHIKISACLKRLSKTNEDQYDLRERIFAQLKTFLIPHSRAEEFAVYTALKTSGRTRDIGFEAKEEHELVDHLVEQLDTLAKSSEIWTAKMRLLKDMLDRHIKQEEVTTFRKMKKAFKPQDLEEMRKAMQTFKKNFKEDMGLATPQKWGRVSHSGMEDEKSWREPAGPKFA